MLDALQQIVRGLGLGVDIQTWLALASLGFVRLLALTIFVPFLGGPAVPGRARVGLAVVLWLVVAPSVSDAGAGALTPLLYVALLVKEALIGFTLGFISQLVFYAVQMAGGLIDNLRGTNIATFFAPQLEGNVSLLGQLQFQAALVLFLTLNGHHLFLSGIQQTFSIIGVFQFPAFSSGVLPVMEQVGRLTADLFLIAVQLSAPVLLVLFLTDVAFGLLGRVAPQINVFAEGLSAKALIGLAVVFLSAGFILRALHGYFAEMLQNVGELAGLLV